MTPERAPVHRRARTCRSVAVAAVGAAGVTVAGCSGPAPEPVQEVGVASDSPSPTSAATEFPDADSTGVPEGVELRASDSITVTKDGTVIEARHVTGRIIIDADDVTVRDTLVETDTNLYPIHVQPGTTGAVIDSVEIDNLGGTGRGIFFQGSGTVRHADIHSADQGIRIQADDVTVAESWIHDLQRQDEGHHDTIQIRSGDDVTIEGNTLQPYKESTEDPMNAAIQIGSLTGDDQITNLLVRDNFMNGGNHTINGGGRGEVESARYSGNRFGRDARYSPAANLENSVWEDSNVWDDTGEPVR